MLALSFVFKTYGVPPLPFVPPVVMESVPPTMKCFGICSCKGSSIVICTHNQLTTIKLKELTKKLSNETEILHLHNNRLTDFSLSMLARLYKLREIYLHNNLLTRVPDHKQGILRKLKVMDLSMNNITEIIYSDFIGYGGLHTLYLNSNGISFVRNDTFKYLVHLRDLSLDNNNLKSLPSSVFHPLFDLHRLSLNFNELTTIQADLFSSQMKYLRQVMLVRNQITFLSIHSFSYLEKLIYLDLSGNRISALPENSFSNMTNIGTLNILLVDNQLKTLPKTLFSNSSDIIMDLEDNMLDCDCRLLSAINKIRRNVHVYISSYSNCKTPLQHAGSAIALMTHVDLGCGVCDVNDCDNGGECNSELQQESATQQFHCDCTDKFSGIFCEKPINTSEERSPIDNNVSKSESLHPEENTHSEEKGSIDNRVNKNVNTVSDTESLQEENKHKISLKTWIAIIISVCVFVTGITIGVFILWNRKKNETQHIHLIDDMDENTEM